MFFAIPEPISLPDGFHIATTVQNPADPDPREDDPAVSLIFHQVDVTAGRTTGALEALTRATRNAEGLPPQAAEQVSLELAIQWTVVEAVTTQDSPDSVAGNVSPAHYTPRSDAFTRCLHTVRETFRAYRQATETPYGLPAYVRAISPVLMYTSDGVRESGIDGAGDPWVLIRPTQDQWDGPQLMLLEHPNTPDPYRGKEFDEQIARRFRHWHQEQERGNPLNLWRERWIEARRAHEILGEEAQAVLLANTSCEVMIDAVLALLMWEEGVPVEDAATAFAEGKALRRVTQELAPRLKGNWATDNGTVGDWVKNTYRLRHRVIHAGYSPSSSEAEAALKAAANLHSFVFDRIVDRRSVYRRAALITVAEEGLRGRKVWSGKIKRFAETEADTEPDWRDSYTNWYRALIATLAP